MANSVDPDQTAPSGAVWSGSALFAYVILSETLVLEFLGHLPYLRVGILAQLYLIHIYKESSNFIGIYEFFKNTFKTLKGKYSSSLCTNKLIFLIITWWCVMHIILRTWFLNATLTNNKIKFKYNFKILIPLSLSYFI